MDSRKLLFLFFVGLITGAGMLYPVQDSSITGMASQDPCIGGSNAETDGGSETDTSDSTVSGTTSIDGYGPPNSDGWQVAFEDTFEGDSLDTQHWSVGFGWGMSSSNDDADVSPDNVIVDDGVLRLLATHGGGGPDDTAQGAINSGSQDAVSGSPDHRSPEGVQITPGTYVEARIKPMKRQGLLPAFWSKPDNENWPPEIDFLELFQTSSRSEDKQTDPHFNVHYQSDGGCSSAGGGSDRKPGGVTGVDATQDFNVYGTLWLEDRIEFYFNGEREHVVTDDAALSHLKECGPHYLMFTIHFGRVGSPDYSEPWEEEMQVDWVRVWEQ